MRHREMVVTLQHWEMFITLRRREMFIIMQCLEIVDTLWNHLLILRRWENGRHNAASGIFCHITTFENVRHMATLGNVCRSATLANVSHNEMYGIMFYFIENDLYFS